jgi:hypothetical protein
MRSTSRGGFSVRSILTFVLAALLTVLLWANLFTATNANAQSGDAHWKGESIVYSGKQYFKAEDAKAGESHGFAEGTEYYVTSDDATSGASTRKAYIIYFAPGTSPPTATNAEYVEFDLSATNQYSNPSNRQSIPMVPEGQSTSGVASSCSVDGIGWIICPVTVFLAEAMDNIYSWVASFVEVRPLVVNETDSPLYTAWNVMRSIANVAFIIAFLIIIYSQLTGMGVDNYGLKKLTPRLIVAAILVNLSFYISAIAVDLSNIAGYGLQEIMINIRESTFAITNDTWVLQEDSNPWMAVTELILSGGAVTGGFIWASVATGGSMTAALYMLIPLLLGLVLTILFVLLLLAARQAIIIILIVIAPLAFVANLLPNTEKWFDKWRDLFMTMLIFFPAFSLVFGGSQLAGGIIIQNATNVIMMIFGLAVQVAPLIITPLLLRLSGGLLSRIGGLINDPRKGLMDRTKNWAGDRAAMNRARALEKKPGYGSNVFRRTAQRLDRNRRYVKRATDAYEAGTDANALNQDMDRYQPLYGVEKSAEQRKGAADNELKRAVQQNLNTSGTRLYLQNAQFEASKLELEASNKLTEAINTELQSGGLATSGDLSRAVTQMRDAHENIALASMRQKAAHDVVDDHWEGRFIRSQALQAIAGGVGGQQASNIALAEVVNRQFKTHDENVGAARSLASYFKLTVDQKRDLALGANINATRPDGTTHTFAGVDEFAKEVAVVDTIKAAPYGHGEAIIRRSHEAQFDGLRNVIAEAMESGNWEAKGAYFDGETRDMMRQGLVDQQYILKRAAEFLVNGKLSADVLATNHKNSLKVYLDAADELRAGRITIDDSKFAAGNLDAAGHGDIIAALTRVKESAHTAHTDPRIAPRVGDRLDNLREMDNRF